MNKIATQDSGISEEEHVAIESALFLYYSGQEHTIAEALTQVKGTSTGTYYRRRKEFPDEIVRIQRSARSRAREFIAGQRQALDAEAIQASKEMQKQARDGLLHSLDCIIAIASGETRTVDLGEKDRDGSNKTKVILAYPRDITAAGKLLHEIARGGCLPESKISLPLLSAQTEEIEEKPHLPILGIGTDFRRVTATAADGTEFTAEVIPGEVIDGEIIKDE